MWAVMPPRANEAFIPFSIIDSRRNLTAASEAPPEPVCIENPSLKYPEFSITLAACCARSMSRGFLVSRIAPEAIFEESPTESTSTTKSTSCSEIELGVLGYGTRSSVITTTLSA